MKKLTILAALLTATTSTYAGNSISFELEGHKIRIEAPKNCDQLSCLKISGFDAKGFNSKRFDDDGDDVGANAPKSAPAPAAPPAPAAAVTNSRPSPTNSEPTTVATTSPAPAVKEEAAPPAPAVAPPAPKPAPAAAAPAQPTPVGVWATEENKGMVRVEPCGQNLCGYATKSGEKILINMKPSDAKWTGQIHDPDSGRNYDSTISMKGPNSLRVQGCAFGGLFCGGQTWSRVS